jgi:phosphoribosyl 1,2-cyclic phosphodiesterase
VDRFSQPEAPEEPCERQEIFWAVGDWTSALFFLDGRTVGRTRLNTQIARKVVGIRSRFSFNTRVFSLTVLGSGSKGNCSFVATSRCRLLLDAGFSGRQIVDRLELIGVHPESLDGILITHEHSDHVSGLTTFCRRFNVPIFANPLTAETLRHGALEDFPSWNLFATGSVFSIKDIEIQSFYVPHDAVDPTAFVLSADEGSIGFLTDLGYAPKLALERVRNVDTLVVETNHDERMLQEDRKRPWSVKQRILSRHGHLSNEAAAKLVASIAGQRLRRVVLGHLSRDCNRPELAMEAMERAGIAGIDLHCADQHTVSPAFTVSRATTSTVREEVNPVRTHDHYNEHTQDTFDIGWQAG